MDNITLHHSPFLKGCEKCDDLNAFAHDGKITIVAKDYDLRQRLKRELAHHIDGEHDGVIIVQSRYNHGAVSDGLKKAVLDTAEEDFLTCVGVRQIFLNEMDGAHAISASARFALVQFSKEFLSSAYTPPQKSTLTVHELLRKYILCGAQLVCRTIIMRDGCLAEFGMWSTRLEPSLSPEWATNADNLRKHYEWLTGATINGFHPYRLNWSDVWYDVKVIGLEEFRKIKSSENTLDSTMKNGSIP